MSIRLQELSRQNIRVSRDCNYCIEWLANDLYVHTDRGLQAFQLSCDLSSFDKVVGLETSFLPCPSPAPVAELIKSSCSSKFVNLHESEFCIDPALWSHDEDVASAMGMIMSSSWSPSDFGNRRSILAMLTNHGCVEFYERSNNSFKMIFSLTDWILKAKTWPKTNDVNTLRENCKEIQTSSICWGHTTNPDCCLFVTSQRNHKLVFWKISIKEMSSMKIEMVSEHESDIGEIKTLTWITTKEGTFTLVYSSMSGVIKVLNGRLTSDNIAIISSQDLWPYRDRMIVSHITWFQSGETVIVLCAKHRHLLVSLIAEDNKLLSQYVKNVNDFTITSLLKTSDSLYIGTDNFAIYNLNVIVKDNSVTVEYANVSIKDDYSKYMLHSVSVSSNNAIWAFAVKTKVHATRKQGCVVVIFLKRDDLNPMNVLLENPSEKLTQMWDCLELLRLQLLGNKKCLPDPKIEEIFSGPNLSTYYMKLYLKLWVLYHKIDYIRNLPANSVFSTLSPRVIQDTLLIQQAIYLIGVLFKINGDTGGLNKFQQETLASCYRYVEFYCHKYNSDISSYVNSQALTFAKTQAFRDGYKCIFCEKYLEEYNCKDSHPNKFCSVSLQQITETDYLACRVCGSTAHIGLALEKPLCTFCDVLMVKYF